MLLDVIPCEVLLPAGILIRRARAWVTERGVVVYEEPARGEVRKAFSARHSTPPTLDDTRKARRRQRHVVSTAEGDVIINPTLGCLCNFPGLRRYTFADVRAESRADNTQEVG